MYVIAFQLFTKQIYKTNSKSIIYRRKDYLSCSVLKIVSIRSGDSVRWYISTAIYNFHLVRQNIQFSTVILLRFTVFNFVRRELLNEGALQGLYII